MVLDGACLLAGLELSYGGNAYLKFLIKTASEIAEPLETKMRLPSRE